MARKPYRQKTLFDNEPPVVPPTAESKTLSTSSGHRQTTAPTGIASQRSEQGGVSLEGATAFIVDALSLIYQVYYAIGPMNSPTGASVNAVFGFFRDILDIIEKKQPGFLICTFDKSDITFRNDLYREYKAHRDPMPDDLRNQIPIIQSLLEALSIPILQLDNFEADDIMATLARDLEQQGGDCLLVTNDKDCRQLITDHVKLYNIRQNLIYDAIELQKDWGIRPDQVIDFQALVGDSVDNVPGIPSVGPITAQKLLQQFGTLDSLLANLDQLKNQKLREKIESNQELARLSRDLVRLDDHVPLDLDWHQARVGDFDVQRALDICNELGFRSLAQRISEPAITRMPPRWETHYETISSMEQFAELANRLAQCPKLAVDTETTSSNPRWADLVGISVAWQPGRAAYIPIRAPSGGPCIEISEALRLLRPVLEDEQIEKIGQNLKYDIIVFQKYGIRLRGTLFDTMVADYLLDAGQRNHGIHDLARRYLNHSTIKFKDLIGTGRNRKTIDQVHVDLVTDYACQDADVPLRLQTVFVKRLDDEGLNQLFGEVEMPLTRVLAQMEFDGIAVDRRVLTGLSGEFAVEIEDLEARIYDLAGQPFNIDSPQQIGHILFDKLKLPVIKHTATGRSTSADVLDALATDHELPRLIIQYRQFTKLKSTYTDSLVNLIHPETGRVHTSFVQDVAATGRLSSKDPNLQNIPIRSKIGRQIRKAFVAGPEGWKLLSADYSQIELRMLAHFSRDAALIKAFESDQDIHTSVAAEVYEVPLDDVTPAMRRAAKSINFGIIYGQTPTGLAKSIGITKDEAALFIDSYFARYPGVDQFTTEVINRAHREGSVSTILGRRRRIEGVRDPQKIGNNRFRNFPERTAINTVIQGSAADLIKLVMINLHRQIGDGDLPIRLLLQIHDELVFEVDPSEAKEICEIVRNQMVSALDLRIPIKVDIEIGQSWGNTTPIE